MIRRLLSYSLLRRPRRGWQRDLYWAARLVRLFDKKSRPTARLTQRLLSLWNRWRS